MQDLKENVTPIKAPAEVSAIGISVITNMPGDRQITAQCHIASDASTAEVNALMDRMWSVIDRQKARYEMEGKEADLDVVRKTLQRMEQDFAMAESVYQREQAELRTKSATALEAGEEAAKRAYDEHVNSGRHGRFKLQGARASEVARARQVADAYEEQRKKAEAERSKYIDNIETSRARFREDIARLEGEIARRKALLA